LYAFKNVLKKRKCRVNGVKSVLQDRLLVFLNNSNSSNLPGPTSATDNQNMTSAGFEKAAIWKELVVEASPVPEPNIDPNLVGQTVPAHESKFERKNFSETFDQLSFTEISLVVDIGHNRNPLKDRKEKFSGETNSQ